MLVGMVKGLSNFVVLKAYSRWCETLFGGNFAYGDRKIMCGEKLCIFSGYDMCITICPFSCHG